MLQAPAPCTRRRDACSGALDTQDGAAMQQQLAQLQAEKARVEADRDALSRQQGQHKATIAKVQAAACALAYVLA